ncbi:MAG: hypothetical protein ACYSVY_11095 [Planctomycetota bacterium]|jgi:hypothetical protein
MQGNFWTLVWTCVATATVGLAAPGCGKRLRGIETADQIVLHGGKAVLQQADGIEARVSPVRVPWGSTASPVGFNVELTNLSEHAIRLAVAEIELHDAFGRIFEPVPPERLLRSFGVTPGDSAPVRRVAHRPRSIYRHRRHYYYGPYRAYRRRYRYAYPYAYCYGPSYWWGAGLYYDTGYDVYEEERRTARFLSELLTDQVVEPNHAVIGHVVFAYRLSTDEELTFVLRVHHEPKPAAPEPEAPPDAAEPVDAATPRTTAMSFRFEVK